MNAVILVLAAAPCVVDGLSFTSRGPLTATLDGGATHAVSVRQQVVHATLSSRKASLEFSRPVAFRATTSRLRFEMRSEVALFDGGVVLRPGAELQFVEARGDRVTADLIVEGDDDELADEDKPVRLSVRLKGIPCSALELGHPFVDEPLENTPFDERKRVEAKMPLTLFTSFGAHGASYTAALNGDGFGIETTNAFLIQRRGSWSEIELDTSAVMKLRGWVPSSRLTMLSEDMVFVRGGGCFGDHAHDDDIGISGGHPPRFRGEVELPVGTSIFGGCPTRADPERRCEFGRVVERIEGQAVWYEGDWAAISFAGLDGKDETLWLDARTVAWPDAGVR
jgi:hypothetical protein